MENAGDGDTIYSWNDHQKTEKGIGTIGNR